MSGGAARAFERRTVLAIESSCDETCAAVVRGREVLSSVVASQVDLHQRFGGVVPEIASRRHLECVDAVIAEAIERAGVGGDGGGRPNVDAVAVTQGPGLVGALLVGVAAAKARAWAWDLPLIAVDHLLGHVASALLAGDDVDLPMLCMLASGGHSLMLDVDEHLTVRLLGTTRDDAAGEAFDKGARLLGLPMPGGPSIEALARDGDPHGVPFTPAMVHHDTLDMSFAGIKTALALALRPAEHQAAPPGGDRSAPPPAPADVAASFQEAIVETIAACVRKTLRRHGPGSPDAGRDGTSARGTLAVVGGVAANTRLRERLGEQCERAGTRLVSVPLQFCGDNAAMIGVAAQWYSATESTKALHIDAFANSSLFRERTIAPK